MLFGARHSALHAPCAPDRGSHLALKIDNVDKKGTRLNKSRPFLCDFRYCNTILYLYAEKNAE